MALRPGLTAGMPLSVGLFRFRRPGTESPMGSTRTEKNPVRVPYTVPRPKWSKRSVTILDTRKEGNLPALNLTVTRSRLWIDTAEYSFAVTGALSAPRGSAGGIRPWGMSGFAGRLDRFSSTGFFQGMRSVEADWGRAEGRRLAGLESRSGPLLQISVSRTCPLDNLPTRSRVS